jgi:predicted dehydrogenase
VWWQCFENKTPGDDPGAPTSFGEMMRVGIIGCGDTADQYFRSLKRYPNLELVAVTDRNQQRTAQFCSYYSIKSCPSVEALLADSTIGMIINLTDSTSHFEVNKACLLAGKHVYSEKPLASTFSDAQALAELASKNGVQLSCAPCSVLGETAQTLWRALRDRAIGTVRLVYAEIDDGPLHLMEPQLWRSKSGAPYHYQGVFESGATVEHAGYYLSWFTAFFGPAKTVTAFSACLWPDRHVVPEEPLCTTLPDFSVACITFESGIVVRLTCSLIAPYNHAMQIVGDCGILSVDECWNYSAPVYLDRYSKLKFRAERYSITKHYPFIKHWCGRYPRVYPPVKKVNWKKRQARYRHDYARGAAELAQAITEHRPGRLPVDYCLHVNELLFAIQNSNNAPYQVKTTFKPLRPMDDAALEKITSISW